tara:strand:+ start:691 stop:1014 length:324 start_codon:yes stop_codon:yes gene_type:complete
MDLFIQLMKTPGLGEEIKKQIIINKNKNIEINKKNLINELQEIINDSLEDIFTEKVPVDLKPDTVWTWETEWRLCESIEEHNTFAYMCDDYPLFHNIMLCMIKDIGW